MNLNEFINYKPACIVCKQQLSLYMEGMMAEDINNITVNTVCLFAMPIKRNKYLTFATSNFATLPSLKDCDPKILNTKKYSEFTLYDNNIVEFDQKFQFKFKFTLNMICSKQHYSYSSRRIKISNTSPEITKGYQQILEEVSSNKYSIVSNRKNKQTGLFYKNSDEPIIIPFKEISYFPINDINKFNDKLQNMIILA